MSLPKLKRITVSRYSLGNGNRSKCSIFILGDQYMITGLIVTGLTIIWGLRLSLYLFKRNFNKEEDFRYQNFRKRWKTHVKLKALLYVFLDTVHI